MEKQAKRPITKSTRRRREQMLFAARVREMSVQRSVLVRGIALYRTIDDLERNFLAVRRRDGEERAILVTVFDAKARLMADLILTHRLAALRQVANMVADACRFLWNLEDRHGLPAPTSEIPMIPPSCRRRRFVSL